MTNTAVLCILFDFILFFSLERPWNWMYAMDFYTNYTCAQSIDKGASGWFEMRNNWRCKSKRDNQHPNPVCLLMFYKWCWKKFGNSVIVCARVNEMWCKENGYEKGFGLKLGKKNSQHLFCFPLLFCFKMRNTFISGRRMCMPIGNHGLINKINKLHCCWLSLVCCHCALPN